MPRYRIRPRTRGKNYDVELVVERRVLFFWKRMRTFVFKGTAERFIAELTAPTVYYDQLGQRL